MDEVDIDARLAILFGQQALVIGHLEALTDLCIRLVARVEGVNEQEVANYVTQRKKARVSHAQAIFEQLFEKPGDTGSSPQ